MSQVVKKAFCRVDYWELKKIILTYFQKIVWFYLLATKDNLLGKVWGKTLFRCEMPWTALTQTESITSRFKLYDFKRKSDFTQKVIPSHGKDNMFAHSWNIFKHWKTNFLSLRSHVISSNSYSRFFSCSKLWNIIGQSGEFVNWLY